MKRLALAGILMLLLGGCNGQQTEEATQISGADLLETIVPAKPTARPQVTAPPLPGAARSPSSALPQDVRRFESEQGYEVVIPADWAILPNLVEVEPFGPGDVFIAPGRGIEIAQSVQTGEINWEEYVHRASQLEDWAAITIMSLDWPYGSLNIPGELAAFENDPDYENLRHQEITVDGREALVLYYVAAAPGVTGLWEHALVLVVSRNRYWGIGMTASLGRLAHFQPIFESVYTSFHAR